MNITQKLKLIVKNYKSADIIDSLEKCADIELLGVSDNKSANAKNKIFRERPLLFMSIYKACSLIKAHKSDGIIISNTVSQRIMTKMVEEAIELGIPDDSIYIATQAFVKTHDVNDLCTYKNFHRLPYIEFHTNDHCNLNCSGCLHFCPLVKEEVFSDFEKVEADFSQLRKYVDFVDRIRIMGGEPLLNPELDRYCHMVHEIYPYADVSIVTNGLLLNSMKPELKDVIRQEHITIDISAYPPMKDRMEETANRLVNEGIDVNIGNPVTSFFYLMYKKGGLTKNYTEMECSASFNPDFHCYNLYRGAVYSCPLIAYSHYFNEYFSEELDDINNGFGKINQNDGKVDLYDPNLTFEKLWNGINHICKACDNCLYSSLPSMRSHPWKQTEGPKLKDYVAE